MKTKEKVGVIGLGYVGLPVLLLAIKKGYKAIGFDVDKNKLSQIRKFESPITDEFATKELKRLKTINVTDDFSKIKSLSTIIVCVPTPTHHDYQPNLIPLKAAVKKVAENMSAGTMVVIESTVNPGVCDLVVRPLIEKLSKLKAGVDFDLVHCPERINPGDPKWDVTNIPRVIGSLTESGLKRAVNFYKSLVSGRIKSMGSLMEAESVKIVENAFRDINIAFTNELAMSFSRLGVNVVNVIEGAATKPFAFMPHFPGAGVGGHCIPTDPYYLIDFAKKNHGFEHDFLQLARRINNRMPEFTIDTLKQAMNEAELPVKNSGVGVLGLSYKPNLADDRNSPSYILLELLKKLGAKIYSYDPYVNHKFNLDKLEKVLKKSHALVLMTAHDEFMALTPEILKRHDVRVLVDGRNLFHNKKQEFIKKGIVYQGIGT